MLALTKPNQESIATEHLARQGFPSYCPRFKEKKPNKKAVIRPLFPRYLFVEIDQAWYPIRGTRGISHVLLGANGPQLVPYKVIQSLRDREEGGLVSLTPKARFSPGTKVKASSGPLQGLALIYEGMSAHDRVRVLVDLLGRSVVVELEDKLLVAA